MEKKWLLYTAFLFGGFLFYRNIKILVVYLKSSMKSLFQNLGQYSDDYLILDGLIPIVSLGYVKEEFILYNIDEGQYQEILDIFTQISEKLINENTLISKLSHGQKIILSALIALHSPAKRILFRNFFTSVSRDNRKKIEALIETKTQEGKEIRIV